MNAKVYLPSSWCRIFGLGSKPLFCMRWKLAVKKFFFSQIGQVPILISLFLTVQLLFWCIVRGLFSLVGTQSPFFSLTSTKLKKSKLCWRWTKKLTKCEATKGEGKRLYTLLLGYSCWLYLVMNENGRRAKKWKWHCTWEEAETGERDHLLAHCQG